jgi:hypothetical protein
VHQQNPNPKEVTVCTIITLCKKAAHPTRLPVASGQHFLQLPLHHPATKKYRPSPLALTMFCIPTEILRLSLLLGTFALTVFISFVVKIGSSCIAFVSNKMALDFQFIRL